MNQKVDHLKCVTLSCRVAFLNNNSNNHDCENISRNCYNSPSKMEFIYGIGPEGLAPIEFKLVKATVGDNFHWNLLPEKFYSFFGHLPHPHWVIPDNVEEICLEISVDKIRPASPREIVAALAEIVTRREHCSCC